MAFPPGMFSSLTAVEQQYLNQQRLSMEAMQQTIAGLTTAGATRSGTGGRGSGSGRDGDERGNGLLNRKDFTLVDKFEGNPAKYKSWMFDFTTALGSVNRELTGQVRDLLKHRPKIAMVGGKWEVPNNFELGDDLDGASNHTKYKGELYALIVGLTTGEAKCVVRGISEKGWEQDGFLALLMLQARYDANTAASLMQCVIEVVNPPLLKNHQGILKGINEWEVKVDGLKMKHNEEISAPVKIAVLVGMLPKEYQDMCFQQATGISTEAATQEKYEELRDKVMGMAGQRVSMVTPTPMDIGALHQGEESWECWNPSGMGMNYEDPGYEYQNAYDIDSVGKGFQKGKGKGKGDGSCHICGQMGHWSRECPSNPKGFGKGGKGGKGFGKNWQNPSQSSFGKGGKGFGKNWQGPGPGGYGKGGNGKGFGYQGTCFNCHQVGHKAAECMNARVAQVAEELGTEEVIGSVEVGGNGTGNMWYVCGVESEVTHKPQAPVVVGNRFSCLTEDDEEEEGQTCNAWPVVGKVGKVGKKVTWKKFDFDEEVKFIGAVKNEGQGAALGLSFQVTDVRKPLLAVTRIAEKGNVVQFGPSEGDNFIRNKLSGNKILLRKKGGSYIMDVSFGEKGEEWIEIIVDSAAEESVCPHGWGNQFGINGVEQKLNLVNASGGKIQHYGERKVVVKTNQTF